jgi:hypothetical protein
MRMVIAVALALMPLSALAQPTQQNRVLWALHAAIAAACPAVVGVSAGPDKNEWVVFYPDRAVKMVDDSCAAPIANAFDPSKVK